MSANPLVLLEAASGFEPENGGFVDHGFTGVALKNQYVTSALQLKIVHQFESIMHEMWQSVSAKMQTDHVTQGDTIVES